ncbi:hypothetical protein B6N60_03133 [Richelia sinica FACHB-800]|uniref:Uncharacterized protein n=1 Tax=Richelia sinica FACHB-800 TaxID=1357546 RepID=A0A975TAF7_9NOST|nr:hypothetical protein [Richelia sinica]QXE24428.1 hypothetical protein B6N60_03133 [Richelia sinica FACHB-800]
MSQEKDVIKVKEIYSQDCEYGGNYPRGMLTIATFVSRKIKL